MHQCVIYHTPKLPLILSVCFPRCCWPSGTVISLYVKLYTSRYQLGSVQIYYHPEDGYRPLPGIEKAKWWNGTRTTEKPQQSVLKSQISKTDMQQTFHVLWYSRHYEVFIPCPSLLLSMFATHKHPWSNSSSSPTVVDHHSRALNRDILDHPLKHNAWKPCIITVFVSQTSQAHVDCPHHMNFDTQSYWFCAWLVRDLSQLNHRITGSDTCTKIVMKSWCAWTVRSVTA